MPDKLRGIIVIGGVVMVAFVFRIWGLGAFMTADEPNWMIRSGEFWYKLFVNRDAGGTFITTHPGVTAMWLIGAGEMMQEKISGASVDTSTLSQFQHAAKLPIAAVTAVLIGLITFFLMQLWRGWPGVVAGVLLAVEPYLTGMSQIAHLDALLSLFLVSAVCCLIVGVKGKRTTYIFGAGVLLGLAAATKLLPCAVFLPWAVLVSYFLSAGVPQDRLRNVVGIVGMVAGMAGLTFFLLWPALWTKNDLDSSFSRDAAVVVSVSHSDIVDDAQDVREPASFYVRTLLGRTTPFVLILSVGACIVLVKAALLSKRDFSVTQLSVVWLIVFAIGYVAMVSLVAKKSDRYSLPALSVLPLIAAWVLSGVWRVYMARWAARKRTLQMIGGLVGVLLILQAVLAVPYAIAYNSILFSDRPLSQQGWGEGLDEAARWLNGHSLGSRLTVASWYPNVFATFFKGSTFSLSSRNDPRVGYVVLYRNMLGRGDDEAATNIWDEYKDMTAAKTIHINGVPYVWIFETFGVPYFSKNTGELLPGMEVGQTVPISSDRWDRIDVGLSTFSGRANNADVMLHVKENADAAEDIRIVRKTAAEIADSDWNTFLFEPIAGSVGKTYYIALTSGEGKEGDAVTVRYTDDDIKEGQMIWRRRGLQSGEQQGSFVRTGDIAYRLEN